MIVLTPAERATLTTRLAQAEEAYHQLMMGGQAKVFVDQNGERVEYQTSSRNQLFAYINTLKAQLGLTGIASGPLHVWF